MKRLSFIIALVATIAVGVVDASAQGRGRGRGNGGGDGGGRGWERREQQMPRGGDPRFETPDQGYGSGRYRESLRQQQQQRGWGRGDRLPPGYGASIPNPGAYRLRQPPPGYVWMRNGRDLYLMQQGTGLVLDAIPGGF